MGGSIVATYTYDANNQRVKKDVGGSVTHYVYGAGGLLYGEYDALGNVVREYVYLHGQPVAQVDGGAAPNGESLLYLHTDHLGTPRIASNTSGNSVWSWDSDAFGNGAPTGTATVNLRFEGQYWDDESGLHYNWNRYYDPQTGRYISSDPIGLDGGLNTFAYVSANPVMYIDPEGLSMEAVLAGMGSVFPPAISVRGAASTLPPPRQGCPAVDMGEILNNDSAGENATGEEKPKKADDPGQPSEEDGYKPPKGGPKKVKNPNGAGKGWLDKDGKVWVPTGHGGSAHGGPHWDVQDPKTGKHVNVYPGGKRR